ncbi:hypothetical protein [Pseudoalteromonas tunicata]|jgi:hypothetical protein|uniref:Uncharacterized protein n=1 Tax=Pseudoalteromonas tunicata D2 TaxID=87626 RepID=A4C4E8_9GAMM|nr:hypothetical protein [Pseudoalteromonas tunicata]ATC97088.1 hypothetical protein PTUN_b0745 [Pseudoalteromonas tunicata]AXT33202.1 hypothetical protein D1819_20525 [Pseudoalteromonas tunicata]EAR30430.1 hypothetical protein PTD2_02636 [Pseudoalteromonas tunicata D2]
MKYLSLLLGGLFATTSGFSSAANLTIYSSDDSSVVDKPVVLVEGYDPKNQFSASDYYHNLPLEFRKWLLNTGRDVIVMTYADQFGYPDFTTAMWKSPEFDPN